MTNYLCVTLTLRSIFLFNPLQNDLIMRTKIQFLSFVLAYIFIANASFSQTNPIIVDVEFPNCYTNSYIIKDQIDPGVFDFASNWLLSKSPNGGADQNWLIMPNYPGSYDFFIVNSLTGELCSKGAYIYVLNRRATSGNSDRFRAQKLSTNLYTVNPFGLNEVISRRRISMPIFGWAYNSKPYTGANDQKISFTPSSSLSNSLAQSVFYTTASATNPPQLTSLWENFNDNIRYGEILKGKTIIPFTLVNDPGYTIAAQASSTPYYRLEWRQYWKLTDYKQYLNGDVSTYEKNITVGLISKNTTTIKQYINVSYDYNMSMTVKLGDVGLSNANNLKHNFGKEYVETNEVTKSYSDESKYSLTRNTKQDQLLHFYVRVDEFKLYRMNETLPCLSWSEVDENKDPFFSCYPNFSPVKTSFTKSTGSVQSWTQELPANSIPTMLSNTSPAGIATASSIYSSTYDAWKALDGEDVSGSYSRWISNSTNSSTPKWLQYDFGKVANVQFYCIQPEAGSCADRAPLNWKLQGFNGTDWVTVDNRTNYNLAYWAANPVSYFSVPQTASYSKFRLYVETTNGSTVTSIVKFKLFATNITAKSAETHMVNPIVQEIGMKISPNPSKGNVTIEFPVLPDESVIFDPDSVDNMHKLFPKSFASNEISSIEIFVYDLKGKLVKTFIQSSSREDHQLNLKSGTYILKSNIRGQNISQRLIIK